MNWFLGICAAVGAILLLSTLIPFQTGSHYTIHSRCLSNLKQVAIATLIYVDEHDHRLPVDPWSKALTPFTKNPDLYDCPIIRGQGKRWGYAMHKEAVGKHLTMASTPEAFPMYFESTKLEANRVGLLNERASDRHEGDSFVAFADGHVRRYSKWSAAHDE